MLKYFKKIQGLLSSRFSKNNLLKFQKLTPLKCDNIDYYKDALDFIFKEKDLLNIAITGSYSAGKSSVIQTYEELNPRKKFIHITLAHFDELSKTYNDERLTEKELEGKIINQLIHQLHAKKIPQTRFKVKSKITFFNIIKNTILIGAVAIILIYLFNFDKWRQLVNEFDSEIIKTYLGFSTTNEAIMISIGICIIIVLLYLYKFVKIQLHQPILKKIKWQNNEIEIFQKEEESYFNKYLDEILYLFQNSSINALVFEDLDRYGNNVIFSKLREINYLVNKKLKNRPIRFIYLLRDDVFTSKDRTKFFDFLLPIVPVLDSSNSYDQILKHFSEGNIIHNFDKVFLERLSLYIDDMRLLKNIYNEYVIYHGRIQSTELNHDKLLAIIVYKNIFPKDFSELQLNSGFVYNVFEGKVAYIKELNEEIDLKIENNLNQIKEIQDEQLNDLEELEAVYLTLGPYRYKVADKDEDQYISRTEFIKTIKRQNFKVTEYSNNYGYESNVKEYFDKMYKNPKYIERKKNIEFKTNNKINELENEDKKLREEKRYLRACKVKDITSTYDSEEIFTYNLKKDKEGNLSEYRDILDSKYYFLIKYLMRDGKIDETYCDYLTYFYAESITREDKIFLRSITDYISKEYSYKLNAVPKIVERLKESDFSQKEILNFDLLKFLLNNNHNYSDLMLEYIKKHEQFDFIYEYLDQCDDEGSFIKRLNIIWKDILIHLFYNNDVSEPQKNRYVLATFFSSSVNEIKEMNLEDCLTSYISNRPDFLSVEKIEISKWIEIFGIINVSFKLIDYEKSNKDLFIEVYNNNLYDLNFTMVQVILEKIYSIPISDEFRKRNYTLVCSKEEEPLKQYVDENINDYMEMILDNKLGKFNDSEKCTLSILNNPDIGKELKVSYIENLGTVIKDISKVENTDDLWEHLLINKTVEYSSNNIIRYYYDHSGAIDVTLGDFINNNAKNVSFDSDELKKDFDDYNIHEFYDDVIKSEQLSDEKYRMLLENYNYLITKFRYDKVSDEKMKILINLQIIGLTKENIEFMRENYSHLAITLFASNIEEYIECLSEEIVNYDEILELLNIQGISTECKMLLIDKCPSSISVVGREYSEDVQIHIMSNKFDGNELQYLIESYMNYSERIKRKILGLCISNIEDICNNEYKLPQDLLRKLMESSDITVNHRKAIFYNNIDSLSKSEVAHYLELDVFNEFAGLFEGKRPKILIDDENTKLLAYFKSKGWISKFEQDLKESQFYRAHGKRN